MTCELELRGSRRRVLLLQRKAGRNFQVRHSSCSCEGVLFSCLQATLSKILVREQHLAVTEKKLRISNRGWKSTLHTSRPTFILKLRSSSLLRALSSFSCFKVAIFEPWLDKLTWLPAFAREELGFSSRSPFAKIALSARMIPRGFVEHFASLHGATARTPSTRTAPRQERFDAHDLRKGLAET